MDIGSGIIMGKWKPDLILESPEKLQASHLSIFGPSLLMFAHAVMEAARLIWGQPSGFEFIAEKQTYRL